jgi:hypothetical protein|tara:strand:+ start:382 stop:930 length:549 start_codon:yes stop_codon:yes gene_type:complete
MDEVTFIIRLLNDNWSNVATNNKAGEAQHRVVPTFIDIRSLEPGKGRRYDADQNAVIVVFEEGSSLTHPTIDKSVRNEEYNFTLHLRVLHQKDWADLTYSRTRLKSLYQIARFIIERNALRPKVYSNGNPAIDYSDDSINTGTIEDSAELIEITGRSEANDRNKRLLGYKMSVKLNRFGRNV